MGRRAVSNGEPIELNGLTPLEAYPPRAGDLETFGMYLRATGLADGTALLHVGNVRRLLAAGFLDLSDEGAIAAAHEHLSPGTQRNLLTSARHYAAWLKVEPAESGETRRAVAKLSEKYAQFARWLVETQGLSGVTAADYAARVRKLDAADRLPASDTSLSPGDSAAKRAFASWSGDAGPTGPIEPHLRAFLRLLVELKWPPERVAELTWADLHVREVNRKVDVWVEADAGRPGRYLHTPGTHGLRVIRAFKMHAAPYSADLPVLGAESDPEVPWAPARIKKMMRLAMA